ncbi:MAG: TlpA family protein disulfide reductase [Armatimonadetes bacterium]|nr:TlpA family protein disulfide reductase [Armatimonadota bacterium]MDE2205944.1 TlpA family protein disulfide reductase [Armatimonadota bacterium]
MRHTATAKPETAADRAISYNGSSDGGCSAATTPDWNVGHLMMKLASVGITCGIIALAPLRPACAQSAPIQAKLRLMTKGAVARYGLSMPARVPLSPVAPTEVVKAPAGLISPLYGFISMGPSGDTSTSAVIVDDPSSPNSHLYVDSNGDGDLTDDPPAVWRSSTYTGLGGHTYMLHDGTVTVDVRYGSRTVPLSLYVRLFDPSDPSHGALRDQLVCYADYACTGHVTLAGKAYSAALLDATAKADFTAAAAQPGGAVFCIDVNGNGVFDSQGEVYSASQPFNIAGTTYKIADVAPDGTEFVLRRSATSVPLIPAPPDLRPGKPALAFTMPTLDGGTVHFPADYHGKLVLLYFWATWCGGCQLDMPRVRAVYSRYHTQGLEILGVSLDHANQKARVEDFERENALPWPQIYEGKYMSSAVAQLYFVNTTPSGFLVDGDSGEVVADGQSLRGPQLAATVAAAFRHWLPGARAGAH